MKGYGMIKAGEAGWMEKDRPVAGPLDAIVRPTVIAPCSSDTHVFHGGFGPDVKNLILGHEAVGEVVEVGALVKNFKPGDIVVVPCCNPNFIDKHTQGTGWANAHDDGKRFFGGFKFLEKKDGVWGEFFHVNLADANLALLPEGVKPEAALMTVDMMSTGFHGVENADIQFGDTVVVMGIGPVGLMCVAGAKLKGAARIIVTGTRPNCIAVAKEYGATDIINYKKGDIVEQIQNLVGGNGTVDSVIIAGGGQETLPQALRLAKPTGNVSNVNFFDGKDVFTIPAPYWGLGMGNITIRGGFCPGGALRIEKLMNLIKFGKVDTTKLITHRYEGFDKIPEAFDVMAKKPADLIKPVVFIKW
ncbi:MAG: zinc-binding dehydrogenase [Elusimicrobiota bacterium]|jgi:threonine dehydrogenase-like Zn-dependent dehydrogenase|nr:zinc-binding dehydrogenase [Elusimicrobiota bacterium]